MRRSVRGGTGHASRGILHVVIVSKGENDILVSLMLLCLIAWGPKELAEPQAFQSLL